MKQTRKERRAIQFQFRSQPQQKQPALKRKAAEITAELPDESLPLNPLAYSLLLQNIKKHKINLSKPNIIHHVVHIDNLLENENVSDDDDDNNDDDDDNNMIVQENIDIKDELSLDSSKFFESDLVLNLELLAASLQQKEWKPPVTTECPILNNIASYHLVNFIQSEKLINKNHSFEGFMIKEKLLEKWKLINHKCLKSSKDEIPIQNGLFTVFQSKLLDILATRHLDLLYQQESWETISQIKNVISLYAINHVLKSRTLILKNNDILKQISEKKEDEESLEKKICDSEDPQTPELPNFNDQGFTRPTVLILVPFRQSAYDILSTIIQLSGVKQVENKKRFKEEFHADASDDKGKGFDFKKTFHGNFDDNFKVGIRVNRKSVKIYSDFFTSDIIVASPLGLRTIIGDAGDKKREFDFLSSIEMFIIDQADCLLMQNWDHVEHIIEHLNIIPKSAHGCDFSRIKPWVLEGKGKFVRQNIVLSRFGFPELNKVFNSGFFNVRGKVKTRGEYIDGSIAKVAISLPQVFYKNSCQSISSSDDSRFKHFVEKILPQISSKDARSILFIPSYFDFCRIRNYLKEHNYAFAQLSEYTTPSNISRSRLNFFQGRVGLLLITERFHFFKRYNIRGSRHIHFYAPPSRDDFYPEFLNRLEGDGIACSLSYDRFDLMKLERLVGWKRCGKLVEDGGKDVYLFSS